MVLLDIFNSINKDVMESRQNHRESVVRIISTLLLVLFVYAAITKIRDYEIFKVRLDQSPMLQGMGDWWAVIIPVALLSVAVLLLFERTRKIGLKYALGLMVAFTIYIGVVLLFFSEFLPCSCNGVFEFFNWKQHLWFNLFFTALAGLGVFLSGRNNSSENKLDLAYDTDV